MNRPGKGNGDAGFGPRSGRATSNQADSRGVGEIDHARGCQRLRGYCAVEMGDCKALFEEMADNRLTGLSGASGHMHVSLVHGLNGF